MRRACCAVTALMLAAASLPGCARAHYVRSTSIDAALERRPLRGLTRNVVLVSIDGLRPDAIDRFAAPTLQRLMREGGYSRSARTILPSKTLPSHTSMLSGEPPSQHGVLWNNVTSAKTDVVEFSTIFSVARSNGFRTAAFFSKAKFGPLQRPGTLDYSQAPGGWFGRWSSDRTVADVNTYLAGARPNLLFVHLSDPDQSGHEFGWMSQAYGRAVTSSDAALGRLLAAADAAYGVGRYTLIVTADHGGHDFNHGSSDPRDVAIPWIAWGEGVRPGAIAGAYVDTFDTAPTALWLLGVAPPTEWDGTPITQAFRPLVVAQTD